MNTATGKDLDAIAELMGAETRRFVDNPGAPEYRDLAGHLIPAGKRLETDAELRRRVSNPATGMATPDSIAQSVADCHPAIDAAEIVENATAVRDACGRPGKSIEVIVTVRPYTFDDLDMANAIGDAINSARPAGIATYGTRMCPAHVGTWYSLDSYRLTVDREREYQAFAAARRRRKIAVRIMVGVVAAAWTACAVYLLLP